MRKVDLNAPLSDEDKDYLHSRGMHEQVARNEEQFGDADADVDDATEVEPLSYDEWTVTDLQDEIRERNTNRPESDAMLVTGNKQQLVARLKDDDKRPARG